MLCVKTQKFHFLEKQEKLALWSTTTRASYIQMSSHNIREFPVNQMQSREMRSAVKHTTHSFLLPTLPTHSHEEIRFGSQKEN